VIDIFGMKGTLTKRTEFAAIFGDLITDELREDCIETLPELPAPSVGEMERLLGLQIDETSWHTLIL